jgi:predicted secreted protein
MKKYATASVIVLAAALALSALAGCGSSGTSANGKTYTITNTKISAKVGDVFIIQLESNATTGFQWGIAASLNPAVVKKVSSSYVAGANPKNLVGAGGVEKWKFKAVGAGTATLGMTYTQPFDKAAKPASAATFTITVK